MKLKASEVQMMLEVEDFAIIAHGYTLDRATLDIWFEKGELVRHEYKGNSDFGPFKEDHQRSEDFEPEYFFTNVKRWYLGKGNTPTGLNEKLQTLFETFGRPLSTTEGGRY